jgi:hypothetical protein
MRPGPVHREIFSCAHHRVFLDERRLTAIVVGADGTPWFALRLLHSADTTDGPDETLAIPDITVRTDGDATTVATRATSSRWQRRWSELRCTADGFSLTGGVSGTGELTFVHAFGGWRPPSGFLPSGSALRSVVSPNPDHPRRIVKDAVEAATIGVTGSGAEPGVGRWLFTPAPWCLAVSRAERRDDQQPPPGEWAWMGVLAPIDEQTFSAMHYLPGPEGFSLRLDYEGQTRVNGSFTLPRAEIRFGFDGPYPAFGAYSATARAAAADAGGEGNPGSRTQPEPSQRHTAAGGASSPAVSTSANPAWWYEPMFCGWGAQCAIAASVAGGSRPAPDHCTQDNYDRFLEALHRGGVIPGTVVVDDKWAARYATCTPDTDRWPDLKGWIADRHAAGQRVLLWWKAWDCEGAPPEACVRLPDGTPVALDPESSAGAALVRASISGMLSREALDADGLKIDFTASTPNGAALTYAGHRRGAALLHQLLRVVYDAAKSAKPDALVITHTPSPYFADVTDMVRLNDVMMLDSVDPTVDVPSHMTHRAAVVRAALPSVPIDTDGWCMPDRESWRRYLQVQPSLGVPALYYATRFDRTGEVLTGDDYRLIAQVWSAYRRLLAT